MPLERRTQVMKASCLPNDLAFSCGALRERASPTDGPVSCNVAVGRRSCNHYCASAPPIAAMHDLHCGTQPKECASGLERSSLEDPSGQM